MKKKFIRYLVFCALIYFMICITSSAHTVFSPVTRNMVIRGIIDETYKGFDINILVKNGAGDILYIGNCIADDTGSFEEKISLSETADIQDIEVKVRSDLTDISDTINSVEITEFIKTEALYKSGRLTVNLWDSCFDTEEFTVIAAFYRDNRLLSTKTFNGAIGEYETRKNIEYDFDIDFEYDSYKVYIWQSIDCLKPMSVGKSLENIKTLDYYSFNDIKASADNICTNLKRNKNTEDILSAYDDGDYLKSLTLFRNYMMDRFRNVNISSDFLWQKGGYLMNYCYLTADALIGKITLNELNEASDPDNGYYMYTNKDNSLDYIDYDLPSKINWSARFSDMEQKNRTITNTIYPIFTILAARFAQTGDEAYVKKMLQLMEDYALNFQKNTDDYHGLTGIPLNKRYKKDITGNNLWDVYRITDTVETATDGPFLLSLGEFFGTSFPVSLILVCKSLGADEYDFENYYEILEKPVGKIPAEKYDVIDPVRFARYIYEAYNVRFDMLLKSAVPNHPIAKNMNASAVRGCMVGYAIFDDFKTDEELKNRYKEYAENFVAGNYLPDGGYLENAFSYATEDFEKLSLLRTLCDSICDGFFENNKYFDADKIVSNWENTKTAFSSNTGVLPNIGNGISVGTKKIWESDELLRKHAESIGLSELQYTSAYMPYSGYLAMRSDWDIEGLTMAASVSPKRTSGHFYAGTNSVLNLTAFGRTLLISGGFPWYEKNTLGLSREFVENGFDEINGYMWESSSRKYSTVIVNGKSQSTAEYEFNSDGSCSSSGGKVISEFDGKVLDGEWISDESFDFCRGYYKNGYTAFDNDPAAVGDSGIVPYENPNDRNKKEAEHTRSFVFAKDAGLWVIIDDMKNTYPESKINEYTQVWNFPAYEEYNTMLTGFTEEQVVIDTENNIVKTTDESGPNLFIFSFSDRPFSYKKYYGYFEKGKKAYGWSYGGKNALTGKYAPRNDIHISWEDSGKGDISSLITLLVPSRTTDNPILKKTDMSVKGIIRFCVETSNNIEVNVIHADECSTYESFAAKTIISQKDEYGKEELILIGCDYLTKQTLKCDDNVRVSIENGNVVKKENITVPKSFEWSENSEGYYPFYG